MILEPCDTIDAGAAGMLQRLARPRHIAPYLRENNLICFNAYRPIELNLLKYHALVEGGGGQERNNLRRIAKIHLV